MTDRTASIRTQVALSRFRGAPVARAFQSIGTSFAIDFHPLHWVPRRTLKSGRRAGGYQSSRTYVLFEFCDWRIAIGRSWFRAMNLAGDAQDSLLQRLVGRKVINARLSGADNGVSIRFEDGIAIAVSVRGGTWWIGLPTGTISPFGSEKDARQ